MAGQKQRSLSSTTDLDATVETKRVHEVIKELPGSTLKNALQMIALNFLKRY